jgi:CDP-paratose 2-epimerase
MGRWCGDANVKQTQGVVVKSVLVTGSAGLIGSEAVRFYHARADKVVGIDNNMRANFFGPDGDTGWRRAELEARCPRYTHVAEDIRDFERMEKLIDQLRPELIIHCAAQPSHDLAARVPMLDFETNALGTLNLLEATRRHAPDACFIFMSTNKVYGDAPNRIAMRELPTRWDYADPRYADGIDESFTIDQSTHSLFGASKVAADVLVQEYGRYFGMKTVCFRGGCLTGTGHSGAELHGFLAYLVKSAATGRRYTIIGYKGKQVRDQIHSRDVILAFEAVRLKPKSGVVYNLGGGKANSISVLEAIEKVEQLIGKKIEKEFSDQARTGDHICYYTDLTRFRNDYPEWQITTSLDQIFEEFVADFTADAVVAA